MLKDFNTIRGFTKLWNRHADPAPGRERYLSVPVPAQKGQHGTKG